MFMGEKFGRDSIWEGHLTAELWQTDISLEAVLDQVDMPLREVLEWTEGSRLELNASPTSKINIRCGEIPMLTGYMGRKGGHIAVRIADKVVRETSSDSE
jgi:flagellar motor switch protein FliM